MTRWKKKEVGVHSLVKCSDNYFLIVFYIYLHTKVLECRHAASPERRSPVGLKDGLLWFPLLHCDSVALLWYNVPPFVNHEVFLGQTPRRLVGCPVHYLDSRSDNSFHVCSHVYLIIYLLRIYFFFRIAIITHIDTRHGQTSFSVAGEVPLTAAVVPRNYEELFGYDSDSSSSNRGGRFCFLSRSHNNNDWSKVVRFVRRKTSFIFFTAWESKSHICRIIHWDRDWWTNSGDISKKNRSPIWSSSNWLKRNLTR